MRALCALALAAGCAVGEPYYVTHADLARARTLPPDAPVPAHRVRHHVPTQVRAGTLRLDGAVRVDDWKAQVWAGERSPMLTWGHALTWVGTAVSLAGTALFLATQTGSTPWVAGIATAAAAEPLMIAGTVLWIRAVRKRPAEALR